MKYDKTKRVPFLRVALLVLPAEGDIVLDINSCSVCIIVDPLTLCSLDCVVVVVDSECSRVTQTNYALRPNSAL